MIPSRTHVVLVCAVLCAGWMSVPAIGQAATLKVTRARLESDAARSDNSGSLLIAAVVGTAGSQIFEDSLLDGAVTIRVADAGQFNVIVPLANCRRAGSSIRCDSDNVRARLKRSPRGSVYRLRLSVGQLDGASTGLVQPRAPVHVTILLRATADLVDVISDCAPVTPVRLACRDRDRPNIVFIVTDDQRWDTLQHMPRTLDRIAAHGVSFTNAFATTPACGPSRASMLTGLYTRNHGVFGNTGPSSGAPALVGSDRSTIATWLHDAGYRTGMYGKYMVGYAAQCPPFRTPCYRPPGWDEWQVFWTQHYYNYTMHENGVDVRYGNSDAEYSTDVITAKSVQFIQAAQGQPFFLHVGYHAPHGEASGYPIAATRHQYIFRGFPPWLPRPLPPWMPPNWGEEDVSDKPPWLANLHRPDDPLNSSLTYGRFAEGVRLLQLEAGLSVDEGIEAIVAALESTGQADNTVIVLTSDNGYFWGEHRFYGGKDYPYEESIRIPLLIRYPRMISSARTDPTQVLNIDIAPTLARLAGVEPPAALDGISLTPLLRQETTAIRDDFLLEWYNLPNAPGLPTYNGVRTPQWKYLTYPLASEAELYDLVEDPFELDNRAHDPAYQDQVAGLRARMFELLRSADGYEDSGR